MKDDTRIRVLVVDDEPSVCETLADYLEDYGYQVSVANGADEALEVLARETQDVALVDIRLPGVNGDALVLRAHHLQPSLNFLIHTGSSSYHPSEDLQMIGIRPEHVFLKPVRNLGLINVAIENLVKKKD